MLRYARGAAIRGAATRVSCFALFLTAASCGGDRGQTTGRAPSASGGTATEAPARVTDVKVGRAIGADKRLTDETDDFKPNDVIYAVVETKGADPNATLHARWTYQDGQLVDSASRTLAAAGGDVTEFHISKPSGWPKGKYKVEISLNGQKTESEDFEVK